MSELLYNVLGVLAVLRETLGPVCIAKLFLFLLWLLVSDQDKWEDFGQAAQRKELVQQFIMGACVTSLIVMSTFIACWIAIKTMEQLSLFSCVVYYLENALDLQMELYMDFQ
jgi:hypothetical protein